MKITENTPILIDFDGTLANTEFFHSEAIDAFFEKKKAKHPPRDEAGKSTLKIFREWGQKTNQSELSEKYLEEYLSWLPEFFTSQLHRVEFFPDVENFLQTIKKNPQILVTSSFRIWLESYDPKLKIFKKFPQIITKDDVLPHEKPDPFAYQKAAKDLGFPPEECIVLEDSPTGIQAGKSAGCYVIAIDRGEGLDHSKADRVISSLDEIEIS